MPYYCHLDSMEDLDHTNLQLYSLKQAAKCWNDLVNSVELVSDEQVDHFKEKLVFILNCFGLSLSQLLGQNCPSPERDKMANSGELLADIFNRTNVDRMTRRRLNSTFRDFLSYYGAIRHFGRNRDEANYRTVDQLTLVELNRFRRMTIEIWDVVIGMYRQDKENDIDIFESVADVVRFRDIAEQIARDNG